MLREGVFEIAGHRNALGEAGDGREEDREAHPEAVSLGWGSEIVGGGLEAEIGNDTDEIGDDRDHQTHQNRVLEFGGDVGADPGQGGQPQDGDRGDQPWCDAAGGTDDTGHRLAEADRVERHRDRHGQVQHQPDGSSERRPEGSRDDEVDAASTDPEVGGDRRERDRGEHGHAGGQDQHDEHLDEPDVADDETQPEEEDQAEDRQKARGEHTTERSEGRARIRDSGRSGSGHAWCSRTRSCRCSASRSGADVLTAIRSGEWIMGSAPIIREHRIRFPDARRRRSSTTGRQRTRSFHPVRGGPTIDVTRRLSRPVARRLPRI